jgi:hypothetical protein
LGWRLLPAVAAATAAVVAASVLIAAIRTHPLVEHPGVSTPAAGADVAAAAIWHTDAFPVGASGPLSRRDRARFDHQKERVRASVRDLSDALVVDPSRLSRAADRLMTPAAMRSLTKVAPHLPKGAEGVTAMKRTGRIGIQSPRFDAAAAEMKILMTATIDGRAVSWRDNFTFWLERSKGTWRVIAFDIDRAQIR